MQFELCLPWWDVDSNEECSVLVVSWQSAYAWTPIIGLSSPQLFWDNTTGKGQEYELGLLFHPSLRNDRNCERLVEKITVECVSRFCSVTMMITSFESFIDFYPAEYLWAIHVRRSSSSSSRLNHSQRTTQQMSLSLPFDFDCLLLELPPPPRPFPSFAIDSNGSSMSPLLCVAAGVNGGGVAASSSSALKMPLCGLTGGGEGEGLSVSIGGPDIVVSVAWEEETVSAADESSWWSVVVSREIWSGSATRT